MKTATSSQDAAQQAPALDAQLCFALYTATHRLTRAYRPLLEPLGLTYVQYLVMLVLWEDTPRSVGELGDALFLDSGTLTPLLKRMERAGLVSRRRDTEDERRVLIELTEAGTALKSRAAAVSDEMLCRLEMTTTDAKRMRSQIMQLVHNLDRYDSTSEA
ncbi:MarR family winged helix-turn-helix transcriptional regulator [Salinisphaera sp. Q1T1-3]|uniref:MarR family winged helix-turn-helix transcriptional regulator n=1 Tax=Salinisphaera sp. Q1T1-3 TaxID=2321229 RepID=UPI000E70B3D1|nr:MarR family transcriptional regulator [Salinisphaera sp. Q1T1-3]RJS91417.1 MarR family transcriptional regulator [Salinisphaera sp. Q1T1-3]